MSRQMPEIYLRGAIFNETMKNLTPDQMIEVENKIAILLKTPSLTKSREKFCQTLANTIGADYREDKEAALQEYKIALMKAIIYVLYHKPNKQVFDDPIQTRKLFSQFTYNYMKQILNENKIPKDIKDINIEGEPVFVAYKQIKNMLEEENIFHVAESLDNKYIIEGDIGIIDLKTAKRIGKLKDKYDRHGVDIIADIEKIEIIKTKSCPNVKAKIRSSGKIFILNLDHDNDDGNDLNRNNIEFDISTKKLSNAVEFDSIKMRKMLPSHLVDLFDIITTANIESDRNQISKILNISINEINKRLEQMKYYYYMTKPVI